MTTSDLLVPISIAMHSLRLKTHDIYYGASRQEYEAVVLEYHKKQEELAQAKESLEYYNKHNDYRG